MQQDMEFLKGVVRIEYSEPLVRTDDKYHTWLNQDRLFHHYDIIVTNNIIDRARTLVLFNRLRIGLPSKIEPYHPPRQPVF